MIKSILLLSPVSVVCETCNCVCVCVFQGAGETVLHREQPQERADAFSEWPDNLARCKL